jgi:3-hydroxyisobutyrate dehydrogenase
MNPTDQPARPAGAEVTFLGAGRMGTAMISRLVSGGVPVAVWNRTLRVVPGTAVLPSPSESTAPVVFSMVLDDAALDALSSGGVLSGATPPAVWVDCSTVSVAASRRAADAAASSNVDFVCAPVSGNPGVVRAGNLIFAASGLSAAITRVMPLLDIIGRRTLVVGTGHEARVVKLCVNAVLAAHAQLLAEVLVLGERNGVARGALMEFINDSAIGSPFTRYKTDAFVGLDLTPAFTPEGQRKDLRLALSLAAEGEVPLPLVSATEVAFSRLVASGLGEGRDFAALLLLAARDAGLELAPE